MKLSSGRRHSAIGLAAVVLLAPLCDASRNHHRIHQLFDKHHHHAHRHAEDPLPSVVKRSGDCAFPDDDPNLVAITPGEMNAGWALSPDQTCNAGNYCPFACKPGMVMAQWDPDSTVSYPSSQNGGLLCDKNGKVSKPFPNKPYCVKGTGAVTAVNKAGSDLSFCQTIYPGNEAMLIPTIVSSTATLAVPDPSYWCGTSAHFYINPPGSGVEECIWGSESIAIGNWSPYVAGANTDSNGETWVKVGWNPEWQKSSSLKSTSPSFGITIECPGGGCTGLPCGIDPTKGTGLVQSLTSGGGDNFCVVSVSKGSEAQIVIQSSDGSGSGSKNPPKQNNPDDIVKIQAVPTTTSAAPSPSPEPTTSSPPPKPTTTSSSSTSSSSSSSSSTSTTSEAPPTTSSSSTPEPEPTTSSTSETPTPTSTYVEETTTPIWTPTPTTVRHKPTPTVRPGIFHENGHNQTDTKSGSSSSSASSEIDSPSESTEESAKTTDDDKDNEAIKHRGPAAASLIVAFAAAFAFL